jgi:uncharacterized protein (DUF433 family)
MGMATSSGRILAAFSVDHAARVTGLSKSRLTRWDKLGFFSPEYIDDADRGNPYARVYSFVDLVGLRTLKILADQHRVSLSELRKAAEILEKKSDRPWSDIPLGVLKRKVVTDLDTKPRNVTDGQYALKHIPLGLIAKETERKVIQLGKRDKSKIGKIERHKFVAHNAEVIAGTRIPFEAVASFVRAGYSDKSIIAEYPTLTAADVKAVRRKIKAAA